MMASKRAVVDEALEAAVGGSSEEVVIFSLVGEVLKVGGRGGAAEAFFGRMASKIRDEVVSLGEDVDGDFFVAMSTGTVMAAACCAVEASKICSVVAGLTIISGVVAISTSWSTAMAMELEVVVVEVVVMVVVLLRLSIGSTTRCISSM